MEHKIYAKRWDNLWAVSYTHLVGQRHHIPVHLDGARVFNAAASLGVDVKEITQ